VCGCEGERVCGLAGLAGMDFDIYTYIKYVKNACICFEIGLYMRAP
jgi:hypothetical protein